MIFYFELIKKLNELIESAEILHEKIVSNVLLVKANPKISIVNNFHTIELLLVTFASEDRVLQIRVCHCESESFISYVNLRLFRLFFQ